jgi:hypothetical protein
MKVQATKQGHYDQCLREEHEVFELIDNEDGTMPLRMKQIPVLDKDGKAIPYEFTEEVWLDADGNAVHRDFAEDGETISGKGGFRGENFNCGWMRRVPDDTECGLYDEPIRALRVNANARPVPRTIKASDSPVNAPRAAPFRGAKPDRTRRVAG